MYALLSSAPTPQTARELGVSWSRLGEVYQAQNDLPQALQCFQRTLELMEALHTAAPTPQTQLDLAIACNRLGVLYFNQNQFSQALPYFERDLQLSEQLLAAADIPKLRQSVEIARQCIANTQEKLLPSKPMNIWEKFKRWWNQ
jgi:tetratricopeptide (TPR) repeat protein